MIGNFMRTAVLLTLALTFFTATFTYAQTPPTEAEVDYALNEAEQYVKKAYQATIKAEEAGANIHSLVAKLNLAINLTEQAKDMYNAENFTAASNEAKQAIYISKEVAEDADTLRIQSLQNAENRKIIYFSLIPIFAIIAAISVYFALRAWRLHDEKRTMKMEIKGGKGN